MRLFRKGILLTLTLKNVSLTGQELTAVLNGELLKTLQEEESEEEGFVWITAIEAEQGFKWEREQLEEESDFYRELFRMFDYDDHVMESIRPLYEHPAARRFLPELTENEKKGLQERALQKLVQFLQND